MDDKTVIRFPNDNTVIRPRPGGKRQNISNSQIRQSHTPSVSSKDAYPEPVRDIMLDYRSNHQSEGQFATVSSHGLNKLVSCASTLLSLMIKLSNTALHKDVNQLKYKLQDELKQFEVSAGRADINNNKILQARYLLCTTLDEIVVSTPWGQDSDWSQQSLLSIFHGETWGGEKFFLLLQRLIKEPIKNLDILELMYICMSLGFQGKYRVIDNGQAQLEHLREDLYRQLRSLKNDFNKELSCHWRGITDPRGALIRYVPLWVVAALSGVILLAMFSSFTYMLNRSSTPVMNEISKLGTKNEPVGSDKKNLQHSYQHDREQQNNEQQHSERYVKPPQRSNQQTQNTELKNSLINSQVNFREVAEKRWFI